MHRHAPTRELNDGKFHKIAVKVKRKGARTVARRGYWAPSADEMTAVAAEPLEPAVSSALENLQSRRENRVAHVETGFAPGSNGAVRLSATWRPVPGFKDRPEMLKVDVRDERGGPIAEAENTLTAEGTGVVHVDVPPGAVLVRFSAASASGDVVDRWEVPVTVPDLSGATLAVATPVFVRARTGLVLDAYFSASKIKHLLDTTDGLRARAARGEVLFGTIDSFLIWRLTGGRVHVTDESNASRTLLYNIHQRRWDDDLLALFDVPRQMLPEVRASSEVYGDTAADLFGAPIPIAGAAGDQQAALFGQACFGPGEAKNTYGTGCFMLINTGDRPVASQKGLLTTVAWRLGDHTTYALEGAVFVAGAAVQWLRDGLRAISTSADVERLMRDVPDSGGVYLVPAFVGLGAPYWDPHARGTIVGLTRDSRIEHIARAAVDAMAYQTRDVLEVMQEEAGLTLPHLKVDGGASANAMLLQFQADQLGVPARGGYRRCSWVRVT